MVQLMRLVRLKRQQVEVKQVGDLGKTVKQAGELGKSPKQLGELGKSPKQLGEPGKPIKNVGDASKPVKQLGDQKKTAAETTKLTETKARLKQGVTKASKKNLGKDVEKSKLKPGVVKLGESRRTEHVPGKTTHVASKTEVHSKDFKSEKLKPDAADKLTGQKSDRSGKVTPKSDKKVITGEKIKTDTKSGEKEKHKLDPIKSRETLDKSKGKEKLVKSKTDAKISKEEKVKPLKCDTDKKMSDDLKARLTTEGKSRQETSSKDKTKDTDVKDKKNVLIKDKVKMKDSSVKLKTDSKKGLISKHSDHVDSSKKDGGVNENKKDKKVEESALSKVKSSKEPAREVKKNRELKGEMKRPLTVTERDDNKCPDESRMESVPKLETTKPKPKQSEIEEDSNCGSVLDSEETNKVSVAMDSTEVKQEKDEDLDAMSDIDDKLSDVTVSSVHTSDLSSFDDELSSVSSSSSEELESEEQDTDLSASTGKSPISNTSGESDSSKKRSSTKALTLNRFYSDSEDDESREERRKKAAKEKEDRLLRRHQMKEEMTERWKQYEEEKRTKREERKKAKQLAKENEEAKRRKKLKKEEKVQAKREQKVLEKKMALRRQRTLNKKYLSSEFTSLFSQKVRSGQFGGEEEEEDDDEEDIDDDDDEDEEIEEGEEVDFKSKDDGMKEVEDNKTDKTDGTKGNDDSDKTGSDIKPEKGKPGRKKKIIDADDKLPDSFFTSSIPDVGPSYEQTFIAKALELSAYSSGLRRSVRRSSTLSSGVSGSPSSESQEAVAFPPEKCGSTSSSTEMSAVKDVTDGRSVGIPLAGHVQEDLKERESPVTQLKEEDFESPATPTQDEPSFFEDLEEAKSTTSGETIPIFSLPPVGPDLPSIKVQPPSTDVDTSTDVKKEQDCEALGVNLRSLRKAEPPDNTEKSVSTRRRDEPRTRPAKSERKEHSATSERSHDTRQHSEHYLSTSKVGQNPDDRSSARPSYGIRPRRQSSREHYKPMSDQFDYYSGKKAHAKDDYPRRRQPSHTRNSPPRESRSRKRMASPSSQEHRPSKYRGYSSRR
uniref:Transcriptional regulator ATRX-like n=1 Tax=Saccoglossus kowalevskii TaxID=10224 RepID=A0ABM0MNC2_SACKO|nr:PREDICTED: transcriptional regulator ATRX-like [Saccoglossus kowalevskii]